MCCHVTAGSGEYKVVMLFHTVLVKSNGSDITTADAAAEDRLLRFDAGSRLIAEAPDVYIWSSSSSSSSSSQARRERVGINRSEQCVWYIRQLSGLEMWFQGCSDGSAGRLGGVFAHFCRERLSVGRFRPLGLSSIFVVRMIYKYFPLVSPRAAEPAKGRLSLKWGHESQACETPA